MALFADIIVPEKMAQYIMDEVYRGSKTFQSGLIVPNETLNANMNGGGVQVEVPFFNDFSDNSSVLSDTTGLVATALSTKKQVAPINFRGVAKKASDLAASTSGSDPVGAIVSSLGRYWGKEYNKVLASIVTGVVASDLAGGSDITNDQSAVVISEDLIIDTVAKGGENMNDYVAVVMHPAVYAKLRKDNLITTEYPSNQEPFFTYMGMQVILDAKMPNAAGVYTTVFCKPGAFAFGENPFGITPFEEAREADKGLDLIYSRSRFILHPQGFSWVGTPAGVSPTDAEFAGDDAWELKRDAEEVGFVALKSLIA